ncbi:hypothetical protein RND71_016169 [Anisodus tanguticus]|uniref:Uncharacterized protein n=1 Tax=Anisodus tanguticus TaxID=243964 RepID=A0AAE1VIC7_9SOLA|nr:hypothetical protein RND71_016169 [Anisodus tanguticus]
MTTQLNSIETLTSNNYQDNGNAKDFLSVIGQKFQESDNAEIGGHKPGGNHGQSHNPIGPQVVIKKRIQVLELQTSRS